MQGLLRSGQVGTFRTKWLRIKGHLDYTDIHSDYYKFPQESLRIAWIPLSTLFPDQPSLVTMTASHGPLALCKQSHLLPDYDCLAPHTEEVPLALPRSSLPWHSPLRLEEGDFIVFNNRTVHASLVNRSGELRVSVDTRWLKEGLTSSEYLN